MQSEKREVQARLDAMREQAQGLINILESRIDTPITKPDLLALAEYIRSSAALGHAVDKLLEALEWEQGQ